MHNLRNLNRQFFWLIYRRICSVFKTINICGHVTNILELLERFWRKTAHWSSVLLLKSSRLRISLTERRLRVKKLKLLIQLILANNSESARKLILSGVHWILTSQITIGSECALKMIGCSIHGAIAFHLLILIALNI